jgi:hypothetical protein
MNRFDDRNSPEKSLESFGNQTPVIKKTKYEGEDQMLFSVLKEGEVFGHFSHIF